MEPVNIENLLDKYFDGQTNLSEEKSITDFFTSNNVPEHLLKYKPMFSFLEKEKKQEFKNEILLKTKSIFERKVLCTNCVLILHFDILN